MSRKYSASGDAPGGTETRRLISGKLLRNASSLLVRALSASFEEVETLTWRKLLADGAALLPEQSFSRARTAALRASGVQIGEHSLIQGPIRITGPNNPYHHLSIGRQTLISGHLHVDLGSPVNIGSLVRVGHDVSLLTISHEIGEPWLRSGTSITKPITIGNGVWIASRVTVLPGVSIGEGSVVAAGSVVSRTVPPHTLVAGVPARVIRQLG